MLTITDSIIHNGKPLPVISHNRVAPAGTLVPSKKEAQLATPADPYMDRMNAERVRMRKLVVNLQSKIRIQNMGYAPSRFKRLVNRENYINRGIA